MNDRPTNNQTLSRYFFIALLLGTTVVFFRMMQVFFVPVLLAAVFVTLFYPMYEALVRLFRNRRTLAAFVCCFILLLGLIVPLYVVADLVAREAIDFYKNSQARIGEIFQQGAAGPLAPLQSLPVLRDLRLESTHFQSHSR